MMKCIRLIIAGLVVTTPAVAQAPSAVPKPCNFLKETPEIRQAERERLRAWLRSIGSKATNQEVDELQSYIQKLTKMAEDAIQAETGCFRLENDRFIRLHPRAPSGPHA
jgi:hypothetical protein